MMNKVEINYEHNTCTKLYPDNNANAWVTTLAPPIPQTGETKNCGEKNMFDETHHSAHRHYLLWLPWAICSYHLGMRRVLRGSSGLVLKNNDLSKSTITLENL